MSMFILVIPLSMCSHKMFGGLREQVRLVALGLQQVGLYLQTLTSSTFVRTGYLGFPPRDWDSSLVNIGWGIWSLGHWE